MVGKSFFIFFPLLLPNLDSIFWTVPMSSSLCSMPWLQVPGSQKELPQSLRSSLAYTDSSSVFPGKRGSGSRPNWEKQDGARSWGSVSVILAIKPVTFGEPFTRATSWACDLGTGTGPCAQRGPYLIPCPAVTILEF